MFIKRFWLLLLLITIITSCQTQVEEIDKPISNKFDDLEIAKIYTLIDKRDTKNLLPYLNNDNVLYRYEAALGFGSIQDTAAINKLAFMLNDAAPKVRKAAAYALGQTGDTSAISPLVTSLDVEDSLYVRQELLESLGKIITQEKIRILQYWPLKTSADKQGLAWGLYRAGLRNVHDGISIDIALTLLDSSNTYLTRLGAAHFLGKTKNLDLTGRTALLIRSATQDVSPFVRMATTTALGNAKEAISMQALVQLAKNDDYRIRINALYALGNFEFNKTKEAFFKSLLDENVNVAITAADQIQNNAIANDLTPIKAIIENENLNWRVKATLFGKMLALTEEKNIVIDQIKKNFNASENEYYQALLLNALGNTVLANEFVITKTFSTESKIISTNGINALAKMINRKDFPEKLVVPFAEIFKEAIETQDIAMMAIASSVITDPELNFKTVYDSTSFLNIVRDQLELPKDIEAIQLLDQAIAYFENTEYVAPKNDYNHPINWNIVKQIDVNQEALIKTGKGDIIIRLLVNDAPGSVANFIDLIQQGYYNGKNFHRVVPNFVIQGGCNRGDGYGGEDYSIRSELANQKYEEGSVGMASAGKDTEGTQWFITHSPTPHLDGNYTIFAKVVEGMDVVHKMEVGDKIIEVTLR
jgi:cyclophilin family peptidyl-prolyl cis-trans isomerase/HEAT repeat protein